MYADVDGMTMYYEEHGNPDGPPLVLLHGFTLTGRLSWDPHLAALGADYRLVVPDLRGHGLSDNPEGAAGMNGHRFAQDISRFCDQIGIERAAFFGYSMGATVVLHLALSRPDLVAAAALAAASFTVPEPVRASMRDMSVSVLANGWFGPPGEEADRYRSVFVASHAALGPDHWQIVMGDFIAHFGRPDADDYPALNSMPDIAAPALVLHGDRDQFFPLEIPVELYRHIPDAELAILPLSSHDLIDEHPAYVTSLVLDFLRRRYLAAAE